MRDFAERWSQTFRLGVIVALACAGMAGSIAAGAANRAPVLLARLGSLTLHEGGPSHRFDLADYIADPDGDELGLGGPIPAYVGLGFDGTMVSVIPLKRGSETITIRATDPSGLYAELAFFVTVKPANRVPVALAPVDDMTLTVGGRSETVNLPTHFRDPEGGDLGYSVSSANSSVVTVAVADGVLTATAVAVGVTTVTATASDAAGLTSAPEVFAVTTRAPVTVTLPDANLRAALERELEKVPGETITSAEMEHLTTLYCDDCSIEDLTGLEFATGVTDLVLGDNSKISDLKPLSGLKNLVVLALYGNAITDLAPLSGLSGLTALDLSGNAVADLTALAGLGDLTSLSLDGTAITEVSPLSGLTKLRSLSLSRTAITDLSPLARLQNLNYLALRSTAITDASPVSGLVGLVRLGLSDTAIWDAWPLAGLTNLRSLDVSRSAIADLTPLSGLMSLTWLELRQNAITDISPLSRLGDLRNVFLDGNAITKVTALGNLSKLAELRLDHNCLTDISALAGNAGLGQDDAISLRWNALSVGAVAKDVSALRARGARVSISETPTTRVAAPTHLIAMPGDGKLILRWPAPRPAVDVPVYEVRWRSTTEAFSEWSVVPCSSKRLYELDGLRNGATYTVEVRAAGRVDNGVKSTAGTPTNAAVATPAHRLRAALTAPGVVPSVVEVDPYNGWEIHAKGAWRLHAEGGNSYEPAVYLRELRVVQSPAPEELGTQVEITLASSSAKMETPVPWMFGWRITFAVHDKGLEEVLIDDEGLPFVTSELDDLGKGRFAGVLRGDTEKFWAAIEDSGKYDRAEGLYVDLTPWGERTDEGE